MAEAVVAAEIQAQPQQRTEQPQPSVQESQRPVEGRYSQRQDLQAALLASQENFHVDPQKVGERLHTTIDKRWDWQKLQVITNADKRDAFERGLTARSQQEWLAGFRRWGEQVNTMDTRKVHLQNILGGLGVDALEDDAAMLSLIDKYANNESGLQKFVEDMIRTQGDTALSQETIEVMGGVAHGLFGQVGAESAMQTLQLEKRLQGAQDSQKEEIARELVNASSSPSAETTAMIGRMQSLLDKASASEQQAHVREQLQDEQNREAAAQSEVTDSGAIAKASEQGGREKQQDSVLVVAHDLPAGIDSVSIVSDGFGTNGDQASSRATELFVQKLRERMKPGNDIAAVSKDILEEVHDEVGRKVDEGGTTFVAAIKMGNEVVIINIGDSRGYTYKQNGGLEQITKDHQSDEPGRENVVLRALGENASEGHAPDIFTNQVSAGDMIVLCSDGVYKTLSNAEIQQVLKTSTSAKEATDGIMQAVKAKGTPGDNFSVVVQKI